MTTIWKYELNSKTELSLPREAKVLCVQVQYGEPQIWILRSSSNIDNTVRKFQCIPTGLEMKKIPGEYIGTFQLANGKLVFHVFEVEEWV